MFLPQQADDNNTRTMIDTWLGYNHNYRIGAGEMYDEENLSSDGYPLLTPRKPRALLVELFTKWDPDSHTYEVGDRVKYEDKLYEVIKKHVSAKYKVDTNADGSHVQSKTAQTPDVATDLYEQIDNMAIRGITLTGNNLTYLCNHVLHYGSKKFDLGNYFEEDDTSEQQLIRFGAYVIAFPAGVYVNLSNPDDVGKISSKYEAPSGITITYSITDADGEALPATAGKEAPKNPSSGDYWLCTASGREGLYIYVGYLSTWEAATTNYIKISVPGGELTKHFSEGDAVYMNSDLPDINEGSVILKMEDDYIVINGILPEVSKTVTTDSIWTLSFERKIPTLDMVCVSNNRVWGCHYGEDAKGNSTNEIYASKLGDFKNWYCYQGISTDSYALSVGEPGAWTGCVSYQGYPTFFKENCIMKIFGAAPSEYQLSTHTCRGVQKGSEKSLAVVNEYLVYKSAADICVYDGSTPSSISDAFPRGTIFYSAVASGCLGKYYLSMQTNLGHAVNMIYDMERGIWHKNDSNVKYTMFTASESGQIYGTDGTRIYGIGANDNIIFQSRIPDEQYVEWWCETGDIGFEYPDHKRVNRLTLRAYIPFGSEIKVQISYDDQVYTDAGTLRGNDSLSSQSLAMFPPQCDHFRLKFIGHGAVRIYTLAITLETTSEERNNGYYH